MDEEDGRSPSVFYYPEDLETFDAETETGIFESQEAIDDFVTQQKSANTNKKTATDVNPVLRYMEANCMKKWENWKLTCVLAWPPFVEIFFWNARKKNREEYEPVTVSSFQHSIHRYLSEKKYLFNILNDNEFEKSRKSLQRSESHLFTSTGKETNRKLLRPSRKTKRMPFLKQENSATPIQLRF